MAYNKDTQQWEQDEVFTERRFGRIDIDSHFYECDFNTVQELYSLIVPVDIQYDYATRRFNIKALSSYFEPVEAGSLIPYYMVIINKIPKTSKVKIEFKKA